MSWLAFALLANVLYSVTGIFDQLLRRNHIKHNVSLTILWLAAFFFIWLVAIPFIDITIPGLPQLAAILAAGIIIVLTSLPYFHALSMEEVSRVIPLWQFSSVFILLFSAAFLGETLMAQNYYGFVAMLFGGMLLAVDKSVKGFRLNKTLMLMLATSVVWAVGLVFTKFFYQTESFWNGFFWAAVGQFIGAAILLALPGNLGRFRQEAGKLRKVGKSLLLATTLSTALADVFFLYAIKVGPVSLVSVVGGTQIMFLFLMTVFLSRFFPNILKENIGRKALITKLVAIVFMMFGLYLVG